MKSPGIISVTTIAALLVGSLAASTPAEARPPWGPPRGPIIAPGLGRPVCGWGGCRRHWHHGHWGWGGALAGAAFIGAISAAAAANQGNCQLAIYDGAGNFVGYRQGNC
jgi:hypothetical protein